MYKVLNIRSKHYLKILSILNSGIGSSRLVGGIVRDTLLNLSKSDLDIDIATTLSPFVVKDLLGKSKIHVIPTGIDYGTVTAFLEHEKFEITTLREDIEYNGRHPNVIFTQDFKVDAARRDFTINALSYCPFKNIIYDYYGGIEDLKDKKVVFIGEPYERIQEDLLRILRFFRFSSVYADKLDVKGLDACVALKEKLKNLSKERIKSEMDKLILLNDSSNILEIMFVKGILSQIFPIKKFEKDFFSRAIANQFCIMNLLYRYIIIFYHINDLTYNSLIELNFSRKESKRIIEIINFLYSKKITQNHLKFHWFENIDYLQTFSILELLGKLSTSRLLAFLSIYQKRERSHFPCNGNDLKDLNIDGPDIGILIKKLKSLWVKSDFQLTRELLLKKIKK